MCSSCRYNVSMEKDEKFGPWVKSVKLTYKKCKNLLFDP